MGCGRSHYYLEGGKEVYVSEGSEAVGCVCTGYGLTYGDLTPDIVFDYAMLGAALRMTKEGGDGAVHRIVPAKFAAQLRALLKLEEEPAT
jgi:hypothetical protein